MDSDLRAVLGRYPAVARPSDEPEPLGNAGGLSGSRLWRYHSGRGLLLARAWPTDGPPRPAIEQVHAWLREAEDLGFVPVPLRSLDGRTLHERAGRLWEVTAWMPGVAGSEREPYPALIHAAFAALAAFHLRLARHTRRGPSPGLRSRLREVHGWLDGGFARVEALLAGREGDPHAALAREWVAGARARAPGLVHGLSRAAATEIPLQPCLRDVRPEHLLFTGDRVTGLLDFGAMALDTVAGDLARLLSEWSLHGAEDRARALTAYSAIRPLSPEETALIEVFSRSSAVLGGGHWVRWHFLEGRVFTDPTVVKRGLEKGLERLGRV